jgi:serine/threonine protein phosphatase PrpC
VDDEKRVQVANVGDSSAFLWRNGETLTLTEDHKVKNPNEQQRLRNLGLEIHENQTRLHGMAICRTLGDHFLKGSSGLTSEPHVSDPINIQTDPEACLVIASDGLWDVISGKHAMEIIRTEKTASDMSRKLLTTALQSHKCQDNVTVLTVLL